MRIIASILIITAAAIPAWAQKAGSDSDKLDIKKLEDKYWSSKDDDFSVVQNRAYTKAGRVSVTLLGGIPINDPYSTGNVSGVSLGYHMNERYGFEATYLKGSYKDNDATDQFITDHGTVPNHNTLTGQTTLQFNYIPLYAKMSLLDKRIIYFDMGLGLILGQTQFQQNIDTGNKNSSQFAWGFSIYQHFFISEHFALKFDFRNTYTSEERFRYHINSGESESARSLGNKSINDTMLLLGLTYFFGASGQ